MPVKPPHLSVRTKWFSNLCLQIAWKNSYYRWEYEQPWHCDIDFHCECRCSFIYVHVTLCHPIRPLSNVICLRSTVRPDSALIYCSNGIAFYHDLLRACPADIEEHLNTHDWLLMKNGRRFAVNKQTPTYSHLMICHCRSFIFSKTPLKLAVYNTDSAKP